MSNKSTFEFMLNNFNQSINCKIKQIKTLKKTQVNNGKELQISRKVESKP